MKKWTVIMLALIVLCWIPIIVLAAGVDTQSKRRSIVYMLPVASGAISKYDRVQVASLYRIVPSTTHHRQSMGMGMGLMGGFCPHRREKD